MSSTTCPTTTMMGTMQTREHRRERAGESIRKALAEMIVAGEVKRPGLEGVLVTAVLVSKDLDVARVFVRSLVPADDVRRRAVLCALVSAQPFLRRETVRRLRLRRAPELRFEWDDSVDRGARIESVLAEISREDRGADR